MRRHLEPICLAIVLIAQVALFTRLRSTALDFDEGVYLLALGALRSGQRLGTDIFAAQPPVFYWILRGLAATVGDQAERIRVGIALLAACGTAAAWLAVRTVAGPVAGVLAAALVTISPPLPLFAARILADLPSVWISVGALALGALAVRRRSAVLAGLAGALATVAVATKPPAALAVLVLAAILLSAGRQGVRLLVPAGVGAAAAGLVILAANLSALGELWDSVVTYHRRAGSTPAVIDRWDSIADLFNPRTPVFWLVLAGAVAFLLRLVRRNAFVAEIALWGWALLAFAFLATYAPIHYNHLVALPVPLALAAAASLGALVLSLGARRRDVAVGILVVLVVAGYAQQWRRVSIAHESQSPAETAAAAVLERVTRPGDLVATDLPVSAVIADRLVPGPLVDPAYLRFRTGSLTPGRVLAEIDRSCVTAVVAGRSFADQPAVMRGLRERFAQAAPAAGAEVVFGRRQPCAPER